MKRKLTLLLLAAGSLFKMQSQVVLSEDFTEPFPIGTNGWVLVDNTNPSSGQSWVQGNQTGANGFIPAFNGSYNDFYLADFTAVGGSGVGTISAFLITPTVTIYNGAVLQFATRTLNQSNPNVYPDRLQVRMAQVDNTVIPGGATGVGAFTDLLLDINPTLSTNNSSVVVTNSVVNGYPFDWVVYNIPVTGVTGTVTGRFAFRYFVTNGGIGGANSRLVGIDAVRYTLPCMPSVKSLTVCSGASATLQANGLSTNSYSWSTGANTSSVVVNPSSTTVYTLYPSVQGGATCSNVVTATVNVAPFLVPSITMSSDTICEGDAVQLTASGASSYTWANGTTPLGTGPVFIAAPNVTTSYTVAGQIGGSCFGYSTTKVVVMPNPTVTVLATTTLVCLSGPSVALTFTGSGATNYYWFVPGIQPINGGGINYPVGALTATTPAMSTEQFVLLGEDAYGCAGAEVFTLTIARVPTITIVPSITGTVCTNSTVTLNAGGADSYTWSGVATGTDNPTSYATGTVAGTRQIIATGKDATTGCTAKATFNQQVVVCNVSTVGIDENGIYQETAIFPNPFTNEIHINVLEGNVVIYNALGQVVVNTPVHMSEVINTSQLPKGAYVVKAYNTRGEEVKTSRLIKN